MCSISNPCGGSLFDCTTHDPQVRSVSPVFAARTLELMCVARNHSLYLHVCPIRHDECLCAVPHPVECEYGCVAWRGQRWITHEAYLRYLQDEAAARALVRCSKHSTHLLPCSACQSSERLRKTRAEMSVPTCSGPGCSRPVPATRWRFCSRQCHIRLQNRNRKERRRSSVAAEETR